VPLESGAQRTRALELEDAERGPRALHRERPEGAEPEEALDEPRGVLGQVDAVGRGELLHPLREADHLALRGVVHAEIVADLPHHDLARVEPHADGEVEAAGEA
jgi:hypothetical protein